MSQVRSTLRATVRTPVQTRTGTGDTGNAWSVREVEILDQDMNKAIVRVHEGVKDQDIHLGEFDLTIDSFLKGHNKAGQVHIVAARPVASKG